MTDATQKHLADALPREPVVNGHVLVKDLPQVTGPPPSRHLIESIRTSGVIVPIVLVASQGETGTLMRVVDGRRRIMAARLLGLEGLPARYVAAGGAGEWATTLGLNSLRSDNPVAELDAIQALLAEGYDEAQIARHTGMTVPAIRRRMRLLALEPALRLDWREGRIGTSVAEALAKLPLATQRRVVESHEGDKPLTAAEVRKARQVGVREVQIAALEGMDFLEEGAPPDPEGGVDFDSWDEERAMQRAANGDARLLGAYESLAEACRKASHGRLTKPILQALHDLDVATGRIKGD